jgi:adenylosuccinate lyase
MNAWDAIQAGAANPLVGLIKTDPEISRYLLEGEILALMDASQHVGDAPERAKRLADEIIAKLK